MIDEAARVADYLPMIHVSHAQYRDRSNFARSLTYSVLDQFKAAPENRQAPSLGQRVIFHRANRTSVRLLLDVSGHSLAQQLSHPTLLLDEGVYAGGLGVEEVGDCLLPIHRQNRIGEIAYLLCIEVVLGIAPE
ncbi:MAG: hypothetical protein M3397_00765 [Actinomycetota bacterium]|nr:hypothetical protein [Actinomycetota bacterium]